jgi:hypothetical protein
VSAKSLESISRLEAPGLKAVQLREASLPFVTIAMDGILAAIGVAGVTGFLGPILTPFISGLKIPIYAQPQRSRCCRQKVP